jgi:AraC-like DNA-binding protein
MWSLLVITCIFCQTAVAFFLLNGVRRDDDTDKHLRAMLMILLVHLSTKFLLLTVFRDNLLYTQIPTGFGLAYGPLLLVIARSALGHPMRSRAILFQFGPFVVFSLIYPGIVIAGRNGSLSHGAIARYASAYEWLVITSLYAYPVYVKTLIRRERTRKTQLAGQMSAVLLIGISTGLVSAILHWKTAKMPSSVGGSFDLRLLPYICFSAIPVLILRYRLRVQLAGEITAGDPPDPVRQAACMQETAWAQDTAPVQKEASLQEQAPDRGYADRRYEKSGMDLSQMDAYENALAAFMLKSRIYLDPELSLEGLASRMKMPKHHLTQLMNERLMKNFYNFVNGYRIDEAIARLNNKTVPVNILSLAFDCGFNSRSSFNNYFKKITGYSPSAYRKLQHNGDLTRSGVMSLHAGNVPAHSGRTSARLIPGTSPSVS